MTSLHVLLSYDLLQKRDSVEKEARTPAHRLRINSPSRSRCQNPQNSGCHDKGNAQRELLQGKPVDTVGRTQPKDNVQGLFASSTTVTIGSTCDRLPAACQEAKDMDGMQPEEVDHRDGRSISRRRRSDTSHSTVFQRLQNIGEGFARKAASATELLADRELRRCKISDDS